MKKLRTLDALLPKTRQGILAATLVQPKKAWYAAEIARRMCVPSSSLQRELRDLSKVGILKTHKQGNMVFYQANAESPVFPELRGLMLKTAGLVDVLADALKPVAKKMRTVFVYGSVAAGHERSDSDIDVMVIGPVLPSDLALPLRSAQERLGREIHPLVYTVPEFIKKRATSNHFLKQVLNSPKLFVLGAEYDLGQTTCG